MLLSFQEKSLIEHIRQSEFGSLRDGQVTEFCVSEESSVSIQERKLIEALREYEHFLELKFADGCPVSMTVSVKGPHWVGVSIKSIRF